MTKERIEDIIKLCGTPITRNVKETLYLLDKEQILEEAGYWLQIGRPHAGGTTKTLCHINKGDEANSVVCVRSKFRTIAVYEAVIALGKEIKNEQEKMPV